MFALYRQLYDLFNYIIVNVVYVVVLVEKIMYERVQVFNICGLGEKVKSQVRNFRGLLAVVYSCINVKPLLLNRYEIFGTK